MPGTGADRAVRVWVEDTSVVIRKDVVTGTTRVLDTSTLTCRGVSVRVWNVRQGQMAEATANVLDFTVTSPVVTRVRYRYVVTMTEISYAALSLAGAEVCRLVERQRQGARLTAPANEAVFMEVTTSDLRRDRHVVTVDIETQEVEAHG
jgi:hypothetical protein